jgi:hypothetical protein
MKQPNISSKLSIHLYREIYKPLDMTLLNHRFITDGVVEPLRIIQEAWMQYSEGRVTTMAEAGVTEQLTAFQMSTDDVFTNVSGKLHDFDFDKCSESQDEAIHQLGHHEYVRMANSFLMELYSDLETQLRLSFKMQVYSLVIAGRS